MRHALGLKNGEILGMALALEPGEGQGGSRAGSRSAVPQSSLLNLVWDGILFLRIAI